MYQGIGLQAEIITQDCEKWSRNANNTVVIFSYIKCWFICT
jgi:hypothetical protein